MASAAAEVPSYFVCPISLQLMRDPVTLPTGISYDRAAIARWLAAPGARRTCPVTRQPLEHGLELTPNHTLRRLIQSWAASVSPGSAVDEEVAALRPVSSDKVASLLSDAAAAQVGALRRLRELAAECEDSRAMLESQGGVFDVLSRVVTSGSACSTAREEAVGVLASLRIPEQELIGVSTRHGNLAESLTAVLRSSNLQSRAHAVQLVRTLADAVVPAWVIGLNAELLAEVVGVVRDRVSARATKASLHALAALCPYGRHRVKIVGAGAVAALVELLLDEPERRVCELALAVLDRLCTCAEGARSWWRTRRAWPWWGRRCCGCRRRRASGRCACCGRWRGTRRRRRCCRRWRSAAWWGSCAWRCGRSSAGEDQGEGARGAQAALQGLEGLAMLVSQLLGALPIMTTTTPLFILLLFFSPFFLFAAIFFFLQIYLDQEERT